MSEWLIASLQIMTGFFAIVGIQHIGLFLNERQDRVHGLLGLVALTAASVALSKLLGHTAETAESLVLFRQSEILSISLYCIFLLWFVSEYTACNQRNMLFFLSAGWGLFIAVNMLRPYGLIFSDLPQVSSFSLSSGDDLLDLRLPADNLWNIALRIYVLITLAYCGYASIRIKSLGNSYRARAVFRATSLMAALCSLDLLTDLRLTDFSLTGDFSFLPLPAMMSLSLLKEANNERQRITTILNALPVGLAVNDSDGNNTFSNKAFKDFFEAGIERSDQDSARAMASDFGSKNLATIQAKIMNQSQYSRTHLKWPVDGSISKFEVTRLPLLNDKISLDETVIIFNNTSDRLRKRKFIERLHNQAALSKRLVTSSVLAKSLAHEITQPLAAILNNAQAGLNLIKKDDYDIGEIEDIFKDIVRDEKRAGEVINILRAVLNKQKTKFQTIKLSTIVNNVVRILNSDLILNTIKVEKEKETELWVRANKTQLQQVLVNIVENALDAMAEIAPGLRRLKLHTFQIKNQAIIAVSDTGKGIPPDQIDRVFDGFYTTKPQGLGVGLEVCRAIMESHGGKVWAQNNDNRGATFYISIPVCSPPQETIR